MEVVEGLAAGQASFAEAALEAAAGAVADFVFRSRRSAGTRRASLRLRVGLDAN